MKFTLARQEINQKLIRLGLKKIKDQKIDVPRASAKIIQGLLAASQKIQKEGLPDHLILKKLKGKLGYGIFLHPKAAPIRRGEVIAAYAGQVSLFPQNEGNSSDYVFSLIADLRLSREEQAEWDPKGKFHPRRYYSIDLDAEKIGNFTRFINHSEQPNIEAHFLRIPRNSYGVPASPFELLYIAKKTIRPGEQLLVCYEGEDKSYWGALKIKPFPMTPRTFRIL